MSSAAELINLETGISAVAFGFFTALFGFLTVIFRKITKQHQDVHNVAETVNGNGDKESIDAKLDRIINGQQSIENSVRRHLEWHMDQKGSQ